MKGSSQGENRATEISEISRSLKALAKELDIPIIALSQLNRALEQRPDKRPVMSDLRECVTGDTKVTLADGTRARIDSLVGSRPEVLSVGLRGRIERSVAEAVWEVGEREVSTVVLASGRRVTCTSEHRLQTLHGWKTVGTIVEGDRVAIPRRVPEPEKPARMPNHELVLLAHLIGDGSYLKGQPLRYTTASEANSAAVTDAAERMGSVVNRHAGRGNWHQLVISGNGNRWHPAGVGKWLKELGVFDTRSAAKYVPSFVFGLSNKQLALFLRHLWSTDGSIHVSEKHAPRVHFSSVSRTLVDDVASLLLRFHIVARIKHVPSSGSEGWYVVDVYGRDGQLRFADEIGGFGHQEVALARLRRHFVGRKANTNVDTIPAEVFDDVKLLMRDREMPPLALASVMSRGYRSPANLSFSPSRAVLAEYADSLDSGYLNDLVTDDLFWDRVVRVEPVGKRNVFDLTVPGNACYLGGDTVNHNSGAIEQDADVIMFIYRDEVYNPEEEASKGKAEILIRKQRNGPIGACMLTFLGMYTRFENYSPEIMGGEFS